jgi:rhodanese-related sulfurtransferase/glyoxylase-like metal-dependent hydrolase (beta-lactamase superfamily II)
MGDLTVVPLVDEGLGNSAYLLDLDDGRALAVDVSRDLRELRQVARQRGLSIAYAADTHLHADFLTGSVQLAATDGTRLLASAQGHREYPHTALGDGDEVDLGGLTLRALATPGHTHEHLAFELLDGATTLGVFTGGSLIVGSAARTDLVSPERTEELARAQYHSLRRLARLDDDVAVWPTHGAGSFCSAPPGAERTSTIGTERATNSLLRAADEDAFVEELLGSLGSFPPYFRRLAEVNRRGPALVGEGDELSRLTVADVARLQASGAEVVDVRPATDFGAGHVPGSLSIPLRPAFVTWLGWLVDSGTPVVVVLGSDQEAAEVLWQSRKIGADLVGELDGGVAAWQASGRPTGRIPILEPRELAGRSVLDVRQSDEFEAGHLTGARHLELGEVRAEAESIPSGPTAVMCGHHDRAMGAASLLVRAGHADVAVLTGGPHGWADATGEPLAVGA